MIPPNTQRKTMKTQSTLSIEAIEKKMLMAVYLDKQISDYMNIAYADNNISRTEIINTFQLTADYGVVDKNELTDLTNILSECKMDPFVKGSATNLLNNPANKGKDLKASTSSTEVFRLIDKWLYGKERPTIDWGTYQKVEGQLFVNGPSAADVKQGGVGDCYFVAALASVADKNPKVIQDMIVDNMDETWTVRFVNRFGTGNFDFAFSYVVVDKFLPASGTNGSIYASFGTNYTSETNELWVAMLEKAYVQWNETGLTKQGNTLNSYQAISGGWSHTVYEQLYPMYVSNGFDFNGSESILRNALIEGRPVVVYRYMNSQRTSAHAYFLRSYNATTGTYVLHNPWGFSHLTRTFQQMKSDCYGWAMAPNRWQTTTGIAIRIPAKPSSVRFPTPGASGRPS
jgi:hypothetical protein